MRTALRLSLFVVLATLGAGYLWWRDAMPPTVEVLRPVRGPAVEAVYATGTVEPVRWAKIASTETGRIVAYPAVEGSAVKAGDVLVRLEDTKARAAVQELEARVEFLQRDLQRYAALVKENTVSQQRFEQVKSELDQARAAATAARRRVADLTIVAPMDGVVLRKNGEVGEVVKAEDVLVWVGQDRPYWITAEVDEEDIPRIALAQRALIGADAFPKQTMEGHVAEITPMGDPINKNYRVRILLPKDSPLMVGMTTEVNIVVRSDENALLIPETALADGAVWVVENGRAHRRPVRTGVFGDTRVEIRDGLADDARVILHPPAKLNDGTEVRIEDGAR